MPIADRASIGELARSQLAVKNEALKKTVGDVDGDEPLTVFPPLPLSALVFALLLCRHNHAIPL